MKNFEEIYQKIHATTHDELENARKKEQKKQLQIALIITSILLIILLFLLSLNLGIFESLIITFILFGFLIIPTIIITALTNKNNYNKFYKNKVIKTLVNEYDPTLDFSPDRSIPAHIYRQAEFESYDNYYSDDLIFGKIDGKIKIELGDIHTENVSTDSDGNTTTTTVFRGLFSHAILNQSINTTIKIRSDKGFLGKLLSNKELMQMDSQDFEKKFDVYTKDKITAMRILTSDILDYMLTFKKENKVSFEVTLNNLELYIRIHCSNMFERPSIFKDSLDQKTLSEYYKYINFMCELNKKFYNIIEEKEI